MPPAPHRVASAFRIPPHLKFRPELPMGDMYRG